MLNRWLKYGWPFIFFFPLVFISVDDNFESVSQVGSTVSFFSWLYHHCCCHQFHHYYYCYHWLLSNWSLKPYHFCLFRLDREDLLCGLQDLTQKVRRLFHYIIWEKFRFSFAIFKRNCIVIYLEKPYLFLFLPFILCYLSRILWVFLLLSVIWASKKTTSNLANDLVHFTTVVR